MRLAACLLTLALAGQAAAQAPIPALSARVTDQTGTLTAQQTAELEQTLATFEAGKGSQIAVLIVPTTQPETIEQYALRAAEQWKLGRKEVDDGALLVVAKNDRALRIEVGYGLEGALNDATSKRIISEAIVPRFREEDYYGGIRAGVDWMMRVIDGEPLPAPAAKREAPPGIDQWLPLFLMLAIVAGGVLRALFGRVFGSLATGGVAGVLVWMLAGAVSIAAIAGIVAFLLNIFGGMRGWHSAGRGRSGSLGWGSPGGWSSGGGFGRGGGGWSGGGGSFGGGGASGRW